MRRPTLDRALRRWLNAELGSGDRRAAVQAGFSLARYDASAWIGEVDVPHAVVVTRRDSVVVPPRQHRMAAALPAATVVRSDIDHTGCVTQPARFVPSLLEALAAVRH